MKLFLALFAISQANLRLSVTDSVLGNLADGIEVTIFDGKSEQNATHSWTNWSNPQKLGYSEQNGLEKTTLSEGQLYRIHFASGKFYGIEAPFFPEPTFDFKMVPVPEEKELMLSVLISPYAYSTDAKMVPKGSGARAVIVSLFTLLLAYCSF
ncbi:Oidioi.mRNA.OKI2018_I69.chr1.g770.t1.cds [Oikopleura dioica]|uniref:Oidioi.mRNA.OKI2018_I69.chr1.g770.t1.cds n=1 Tax=Oikopleura dioica TaxID=34765 RepID=A0ABN7SKW5_OIKDI|nr:Oidioi.mRNA.OKI2018_I69.chr1.g770.t1.cds [Oikopleura dioica]